MTQFRLNFLILQNINHREGTEIYTQLIIINSFIIITNRFTLKDSPQFLQVIKLHQAVSEDSFL